jgi:hypothetical protein
MKRGIRNANIGIALSAVVLAVGFPFCRDSDGATELLALGALAVALGTLFLLDWRDDRTAARRAP